MSLSRILLGRRSVYLAGRRFVVRPPTVRTFLLVLDRFAKQIGLIWQGGAAAGEDSESEIVTFFCSVETEAMRELVGTCVDESVDDLGPGELSTVVMVALSLCDPAEVVRLMAKRTDSEPEQDDPAGKLVCALAERFHVDPLAVLDWPIGLFVSAHRYAIGSGPDAETHEGTMVVDLRTEPAVNRAAPVVGGPERFRPRGGAA